MPSRPDGLPVRPHAGAMSDARAGTRTRRSLEPLRTIASSKHPPRVKNGVGILDHRQVDPQKRGGEGEVGDARAEV